ncbi:MAG: D-alanine--D-alanine ligase [Acidobacteria bacterium]|nr:D-alanine--D-alanine ligase [Acidobacteriota bacterium]MBU4307375.1 D-alanine--D-alanine ligase [Acidobacteriota bacterium]MCG2811634.1 D-alanine--D-alanine ligase [Candidatus Aminicenantes bacterium]
MIIGLTYDLRQDYLDAGYSEEQTVEFDRPDTIAAIEKALSAMGHKTMRIGNVKSLVQRLAAGERWDMVFNICEGMFGLGREAQVPALLDAYQIPYTFSGPLVLALTLDKALTKRVVRSLGVATPDFAVVAAKEDIAAVDLPFPLFAKPLAEGTGLGIDARSKIDSRRQLTAVCCELLEKFKQPVLVETYLPGREFTVGIVGSGTAAEAVGVMEVFLRPEAEANAYSYVNKENSEELVQYALAPEAEASSCRDVALRTWRGLGCLDAGRVDLKMDGNGAVNFIEVNPLAGLHPEHSDLPIICSLVGIPFQTLMERIMASAGRRARP